MVVIAGDYLNEKKNDQKKKIPSTNVTTFFFREKEESYLDMTRPLGI